MWHCHVRREYSVVITSVLVFSSSVWGPSRHPPRCGRSSVSWFGWSCHHRVRSCGRDLRLYVDLFLFGSGTLIDTPIRRETTYDQPNVWPYVLRKHSATVQNNLSPLKVYLSSMHVFVSSVYWTDKNEHYVYRTHNQLNWKCPHVLTCQIYGV